MNRRQLIQRAAALLGLAWLAPHFTDALPSEPIRLVKELEPCLADGEALEAAREVLRLMDKPLPSPFILYINDARVNWNDYQSVNLYYSFDDSFVTSKLHDEHRNYVIGNPSHKVRFRLNDGSDFNIITHRSEWGYNEMGEPVLKLWDT